MGDVVHSAFIDIEARLGVDLESLLGSLGCERNIEDGEHVTGVMDLADMHIEIRILNQAEGTHQIGQIHIEVGGGEGSKERLEFPPNEIYFQLVAQQPLKRFR